MRPNATDLVLAVAAALTALDVIIGGAPSFLSYLAVPVIIISVGFRFNENEAKDDPFRTAQRLLVSLMLPFVVLCAAVLFVNGAGMMSYQQTLLLGDVASTGTMAEVLWLLPALFIGELIFMIILLTTDRLRAAAVVLVALAGLLLPTQLPWQLQAVLLIQPLLYIGYAYRRYVVLRTVTGNGPLTLLMGAGMMSAAAIVAGPASLHVTNASAYGMLIVGAVGGAMILTQLANWISRLDATPLAVFAKFSSRHAISLAVWTIAFGLLALHTLYRGDAPLYSLLSLFVGLTLALSLCWCVDKVTPYIPVPERKERNLPAVLSSLFHLPMVLVEPKRKR